MFAIFETVESQALFAIFEHHACELACAQPPTLGIGGEAVLGVNRARCGWLPYRAPSVSTRIWRQS